METIKQVLLKEISNKKFDLDFLKFNMSDSSQNEIALLETEISEIENFLKNLDKPENNSDFEFMYSR